MTSYSRLVHLKSEKQLKRGKGYRVSYLYSLERVMSLFSLRYVLHGKLRQ